MDRDMGGRGMRGGMYDDGRGRGGYDAMVVAEAMGRLGRGGYGMDMEMDSLLMLDMKES